MVPAGRTDGGLLGSPAFSSSPMSGVARTGLVGATLLAVELAAALLVTPSAGFAAYDQRMRPFVEPPWIVWLCTARPLRPRPGRPETPHAGADPRHGGKKGGWPPAHGVGERAIKTASSCPTTRGPGLRAPSVVTVAYRSCIVHNKPRDLNDAQCGNRSYVLDVPL